MTKDDVEYLVVHTAAFPHRNCDRDVIDGWHKLRGWAGIGYHYVIANDLHDRLEDGAVQEGRRTSTPGAHVQGINARSLGICCAGHGDLQPHTAAQRKSLLGLLSDLMDEYPGVTADRIIGHREVNDLVQRGLVAAEFRTSKTCPGAKVDMDEIRGQVRALRGAPARDRPDGPRPTDKAIRKALEVLGGVPASVFPNAHDELRAFLFHPEVLALREERED
jgi:N-acetyl-anhydromuramyl-L-alanine amidase AmpD